MKSIFTFCVVFLLAMPSMAQVPSLDESFEQLPKYTFGENRMGLNVIEEAVATTDDPAALEQRLLAVLEAGATDDAKRFICRALGWIGTDASKEAMEALLDNPEIAGHAQLVLNNLAQGTGMLRAEFPENCEESLQFLNRADPDDYLKVEAADRLLACAEAWCAAGDTDKAATVYAECNKENYPEHIRAAGLVGQIELNPEKALSLVEAALTDPVLLRACLPYVRSIEGKKASKAFATALATVPESQTAAYIKALADRKDAATADVIAPYTESEDAEVQIAALLALGKVGGSDHARQLLKLSVESSGDTKRAAKESLLRLNADGVDKALLKLGKVGSDDLTLAAIRALGERRALSQKDDVLALLEKSDNGVRRAALDSLKVLGTRGDLSALIALLATGDYEEQRRAVESTVTAILQRIEPADARDDDLLEVLASADDPALVGSLMSLLGSVPSSDGLSALQDALKSENYDVRRAAIKSLSSWPSADPVPALIDVIETASVKEEVSAAVSGVIGLLNGINPRTPDLLESYKAIAAHLESAGDKNKYLSGLSSLASMETFELAAPYLEDKKSNASAALAVARVAYALSGAYPELAASKVQPFLGDDYPEPIRQQAQSVLDAIERNKNYLMAWELAGPYMIEGKPSMSFFDHDFEPVTNPDQAPWRIMPPAARPDQVGVLDLAAVIGGFERVAYLRTTLTAESAKTVTFLLGSNDGCKVWFNGEVILAKNFGRPLKAGEDVLKLDLKQGENTLMVAVSQHGGAWAMIAQLKNDKGVTAHVK